MMKRYLIWSTLAVLFLVGLTNHAQAQRPAHYYPSRPTFSPYLFYRQFNGTGLPNYYTFVRPQTVYNDFLSRTQARPSQSRQTLIGEREVSEIVDSQLRQRATTGIGQVAEAAQFSNTSHYYPRSSPPRRR